MRTNLNTLVKKTFPEPITREIENCKSCGFHSNSSQYLSQVMKHEKYLTNNVTISQTDLTTELTVHVIFHLITPKQYLRSRTFVDNRARELLANLNNDFNNYSSDPHNYNSNNAKYKEIIRTIYSGVNPTKEDTYLSKDYVEKLPSESSKVKFVLSQTYIYDVNSVLDLRLYDDSDDAVYYIRKFIINNRAHALYPESYLNIWVVDITNTTSLGYSSFPWEAFDDTYGIIISLRVFFPHLVTGNNYNMFKVLTHETGHYLGLLHVFSNNSTIYNSGKALNVNAIQNDKGDLTDDTPDQNSITLNPLKDQNLMYNNSYNPLFMNFMDYTYDKFIVSFTKNQIQKMRYVLLNLRKDLTSDKLPALPNPKDDFNVTVNSSLGQINQLQIPITNNSRLILPETQDTPLKTFPIQSTAMSNLAKWKSNLASGKIPNVTKSLTPKVIDVPPQLTKNININNQNATLQSNDIQTVQKGISGLSRNHEFASKKANPTRLPNLPKTVPKLNDYKPGMPNLARGTQIKNK
jgi:hypothetical protein